MSSTTPVRWANRRLLVLLGKLRPASLAARIADLLKIPRAAFDVAEGTFWIDPVSHFGRTLILEGAYEPGMTACLRRHLSCGMTFVDLGANEGYFSVIASRLVGSAGKVVAVEPQPGLQPVLAKNFELNHCANVRIVPVAVGDRRGRLPLYLYPRINPGAASLWRPTKYRLPTVMVDVVPLATVFEAAGIRRCDLLKIDVEGGEYEVLLGAAPLLASRKVGKIALEIHGPQLARRGLSPNHVRELLAAHGYVLESASQPFVYRPAG